MPIAKQLVWEATASEKFLQARTTMDWFYMIRVSPAGIYRVRSGERFTSLQEAKDWCQADYEKRIREALDFDAEPIITKMGDLIADLIDQAIKGKWVDEHGHSVLLNDAMFRMRDQLVELGEIRHKHFDWSEFKL